MSNDDLAKLIEVSQAILIEADQTGGRIRKVSRYEIDRLRAALSSLHKLPAQTPATQQQ